MDRRIAAPVDEGREHAAVDEVVLRRLDPGGVEGEALEEALARHGKPDVFNTDQGSQFTSQEFTGVLLKAGSPSAWTARSLARQRLRRAALAVRQVRGDLPQGL